MSRLDEIRERLAAALPASSADTAWLLETVDLLTAGLTWAHAVIRESQRFAANHCQNRHTIPHQDPTCPCMYCKLTRVLEDTP